MKKFKLTDFLFYFLISVAFLIFSVNLIITDTTPKSKELYQLCIEDYDFNDRGCIIIKGSDNVLGLRFLLLEGYCIELDKEEL